MKNKYYAFDWDDNLFYMPTHIVLFENGELNRPYYIETHLFAKVRKKLNETIYLSVKEYNGKKYLYKGEAKDVCVNKLEIVLEDEASFEEFRDYEEKNIFLDQLKEAVSNKQFAPAWEDFVEACSHKDTALNTYIITARGHNPVSIAEAVVWLQSIGLIKYTIPIKNIHPVSFKGNPKYQGNADKPSVKKLAIIKEIIEHIKDKEVKTFGFSDDDQGTIKMLEDEYHNLNDPNVKVSLYYTGNKIKEKLK